MAKVSVLVPVYNQESRLRPCLDSLVGQTLTDLEIIAVNDASTDGSLDVLRDYERRFPEVIRVVDVETNAGLGAARNLGMAHATGEYIGFVDSDDWVDPSMFERLLSVAQRTSADIVDCDYYEYDESTDRLESRLSHRPEELGRLTDGQRKELILYRGSVCTKLYSRMFLESAGIRFPEGVVYEDLLFIMLSCLAKRIEKVEVPLYVYRATEGSLSRPRNSERVFDRLRSAEIVLEEALRRGLDRDFGTEIEMNYVDQYYISTIAAVLFSFDRPDISRLDEMRRHIHKRFPRYRSNPYFRRVPMAKRAASKMNDVSPALLVSVSWMVKRLRLANFVRRSGSALRRR